MSPATSNYSRYSSSPPSSPFDSIIDSSPASSPSLDPIIVDPQASPIHPFAGSTHANRKPPHYEKKVDVSFEHSSKRQTRFRPLPVDRILTSSFEETDMDVSDVPSSFTDCSLDLDPEQDLWDRTIASAIDNADGKVDLSDHRLTFIPSTISDLASLVVLSKKHTPASQLHTANRVPMRVATSMVMGPGRAAQRVRSLATARTASAAVFASRTSGAPHEEIHLYLGNNSIRFLPNELFNLSALVVLSLRGNSLQELPPLIGQLVNLRELNVSLNKLNYLPSEIQNLHLTSLAIEPNPFYPQPFREPDDQNVPISETRRLFGQIPPLTELALRTLMSPNVQNMNSMGIENSNSRSVFETFYDLPLSLDWCLSPPIEQILTSCVPNCISSDLAHTRRVSGMTTSVSTCPGLAHRNVGRGDQYKRPVFINHAEEIFTWEAEIAGVRVTRGAAGGRIPLRWRGCRWGCLDYLSSSSKSARSNMMMEMDIEMEVKSSIPTSIPTIGDGDTDLDNQFSSNGFEFDDEE